MASTLLRHGSNKRKQLEQDLAHISQEMYKRNAELAAINQTLSLLRTIDSLVLESHDSLEVLCTKLTRAIVDKSEYSWVAIFGKLPHHERLDMLGWAGNNIIGSKPDEATRAYLSIDSSWIEHRERIHNLHLQHASDQAMASYLHSSPEFVAILRNNLHVNMVYFIKLMARQKLVGIMTVGYPSNFHELSEDNRELLDRLSEAVGVALDNRLLFEENQQVLNQLQATNHKLRALDQAKDEFISMASHQLRTPLTSMKGYVSMVLEGDSGKVTKGQQKLLQQAFASSQRMVYLIADLLNVSRLKTGKFVIENKPTNLAEVVKTEMEQLQTTAKSKNLELTFEKPKIFPTLFMDETKIRQVIMNFADNAIYYTPSGGHINIKLTIKGDVVEFTISDDGIGVPKDVQHHLFTKFYRADNARQARPDGTGLGLFMAQKVIVAQGGAIIFHSQEGRGSTFGFSFSKKKLKVPSHYKDNTT
jgi:signal transduction histidine kinase